MESSIKRARSTGTMDNAFDSKSDIPTSMGQVNFVSIQMKVVTWLDDVVSIQIKAWSNQSIGLSQGGFHPEGILQDIINSRVFY